MYSPPYKSHFMRLNPNWVPPPVVEIPWDEFWEKARRDSDLSKQKEFYFNQFGLKIYFGIMYGRIKTPDHVSTFAAEVIRRPYALQGHTYKGK